MMTAQRRSAWSIAGSAALVLALAGCASDDVVDVLSTAVNLPAVGVTAQGLGFTVVAREFTFEQTYSSPTEGDSLDVGLAVTNFRAGSVLIEIRDAGGVARYQQTLTSGIAQGQATVAGTPPYTVHLRFTGFSAVFALGVAAHGP